MIYVIVIIVIILLLLAGLILESRRELNTVKITEYTVNSDVPDSLKGRSIVFLSDYHEAEGGKLNDRLTEMIDSVNPMCILAGGDMVNSNEDPAEKHPSLEFLNGLAKKYKLYYAYGNHERRLAEDYHQVGAKWKKYLKRLDKSIEILANKGIPLTDDVYIYGLDIPIEKYGRIKYLELTPEEIKGYVGEKPEDKYVILMGHAPDFFEGYSGWGAELILSGHFHGGIVRLPFFGGVISPRLCMFPKYDYGRYTKGGSTMLVTNGIGQHSIKLRFNNIPEIVVIRFS